MSSLKKNIGYQTVFQIINTCLPLITSPYLSRVLGAGKLGIFSYANSVNGYFVLFAMLGIVNYGTRCVAEVQTREESRSRIFCEIYCLQLISGLTLCLLYGLYLAFFVRDNFLIFLIHSLALLACLFDISWLFLGLEEIRFLVARSMPIRIGTVLLILLLVKDPGDLWIYTLIMVSGTMLGQILLWTRLKRYVRLTRVTLAGVKRHLKPMLVLFVPLLALSIFHLMDKTMLGSMSSYEQSGYYYNADKVINIPTGVLAGIGTVMLPRSAALLKSGQRQEADNLFVFTIEGIFMVSAAVSFGIAAVAPEFVPFFFGKGYDPCVWLILLLSPVLLLKSLSLTVRNAYLIPRRCDSVYIRSVIAGALVNLIANLLLIPHYGAVGAVLGTLLAEGCSCLWQYVCIWRKLDLRRTAGNSLAYFIMGLIMYVSVRSLASRLMLPYAAALLVEIGFGALVYGLFCLLFWRLTGNQLLQSFLAARKH